jgi:hypothetical protein
LAAICSNNPALPFSSTVIKNNALPLLFSSQKIADIAFLLAVVVCRIDPALVFERQKAPVGQLCHDYTPRNDRSFKFRTELNLSPFCPSNEKSRQYRISKSFASCIAEDASSRRPSSESLLARLLSEVARSGVNASGPRARQIATDRDRLGGGRQRLLAPAKLREHGGESWSIRRQQCFTSDTIGARRGMLR